MSATGIQVHYFKVCKRNPITWKLIRSVDIKGFKANSLHYRVIIMILFSQGYGISSFSNALKSGFSIN